MRFGAVYTKVSPKNRRLFFSCLRAENPSPTTELVYGNRYQLLVAVVLSAQATDKGVNAATKNLFRRVKTPATMCALGEAALIDYIKTIGLFRAKARHVIQLSAILLEKHGGRVPSTRTDLEALPGVGRKTANVVLNTAFGENTIAVDTHIFRVSNRTGLASGKNVRAVEERLNAVVEDEFKRNAHHWLILLGRYICKARQPLCDSCPVNAYCDYPDKKRLS